MKIYLIPGLGFDNRIFHNLNLASFNIEYLDWTEPQRDDSFKSYAARFSDQVNNQNGKTILIGHSMGGMISQEIAMIKNIDQIILISSIKSRNELPPQFKVVSPLKLHNFFTKKLVLNSFNAWGNFHDYKTEEEQELFRDMISKNSDSYLKWALKELSLWQTPTLPKETKLFQIHGDADNTFPVKYIQKPDMVLEKAGHFMVYKCADQISETILRLVG